jgi:hypothetical protein
VAGVAWVDVEGSGKAEPLKIDWTGSASLAADGVLDGRL